MLVLLKQKCQMSDVEEIRCTLGEKLIYILFHIIFKNKFQVDLNIQM